MSEPATTDELASDSPVPPVAPASPSGTAGGKPGLNDLLAQFDASGAAPRAAPDKPVDEPAPEQQARDADWGERFAGMRGQLEEIAPFISEALERQDNDDVSSLLSAIKGRPELKDLPDGTIEMLLQGVSASNQELQAAFQNRHSDPDAWKRAGQTAEQQIAQMAGAMASAAEEKAVAAAQKERHDIEAAYAAVRNLNTGTQLAQEHDVARLNSMSDQEFEAYKKQLARNPSYRG